MHVTRVIEARPNSGLERPITQSTWLSVVPRVHDVAAVPG